jgi:hypothetical protein
VVPGTIGLTLMTVEHPGKGPGLGPSIALTFTGVAPGGVIKNAGYPAGHTVALPTGMSVPLTSAEATCPGLIVTAEPFTGPCETPLT